MCKKRSRIQNLAKGAALSLAAVLCSCSNQLAETTTSTVEAVDNVLSFADAPAFLKMLGTSTEPSSGAEISRSVQSTEVEGFTSMLDVIPDPDEFQTEEDFYAFLAEYPEVLTGSDYTDSEGNNVVVYDLPIAPELAALVTPEGLVSVGGKTYNVLDEEQFAELEEVCKNSSPARWMWSTPDSLTTAIPLVRGATVPLFYKVTDCTLTVRGRNVVVQMWKGYLPGLLAIGGVGAEVGLYNKISKNTWVPDYKHCADMSFALVYKKTGQVYLSHSDFTWWLNRWRVGEKAPSILGNDYTLRYTIDGKTRSW